MTLRRGPQRSAYQVFVCHATSDKWLACTICEKIEAAGATTFRDDRDIDGGDDIPEEIRRQIKRSRELLVILTPQSVARWWVALEVGAAWMERIRIVPILEHITMESVPGNLKLKKALSLNEFDHYLIELRKRVGG